MKYSRNLFLVLAFVAALAALPTQAGAQNAADWLSSSDVQCVVEPVYTFIVPPDAQLNYPDTRMTLGEFSVGELLLASGETLSVTLTPGALQTVNGDAVPFEVSFSPPAAFGNSESGEAYDVAVEVDAEAFSKAAAGTYTASLMFSVISHPANVIVWRKTTVFMVVKTQNIGQEGVPSTGIFNFGNYWWLALAAFVCIALGLYAAVRKARKRKKAEREESSPIRDDNDSSPAI